VSEEDHRHCKVCGRVCDVDSETCSTACRQKREAAIQSRRMWTYLLYGTAALLLILLVSKYIV
jgi:predicted nucleic acid-binding Zn ribbon protein